MATSILELGLEARSGELLIGEAALPPEGERIQNISAGRWEVRAKLLRRQSFAKVLSFELTISEESVSSTQIEVAIDGGVMALADPDISQETPRAFFARWKARRQFEKSIMKGLKGAPKDPYVEQFQRKDGSVWAVAFNVPDDIYQVVIFRDRNGNVARIACDVKAYGND